MSQTQPQKSKAIRFGSGVLKVDGVNIWLLDNAKLLVEYNVIQIKAHNGYLPPKKKASSVKFTAELYEIDPANLYKVDGGGTVTTIAGTPVNVVNEAVTASWVVGTLIRLANHNGAGTIVTSPVLKVDGTTKTLNTDYKLVLLDGQSYIEPLTSQSWVITINYTYTPNASTRYSIKDLQTILAYHDVVFENSDENGKKFKITIPKANASGNVELGFVSDEAVDEVMKLPIEFTANPDDDNYLVHIDDEQTS